MSDTPNSTVDVEKIQPEIPASLSKYILKVGQTRLFSNDGMGRNLIRKDQLDDINPLIQDEYRTNRNLKSTAQLSLQISSDEHRITRAIRPNFNNPAEFPSKALQNIYVTMQFTDEEKELARQVFEKELAIEQAKQSKG